MTMEIEVTKDAYYHAMAASPRREHYYNGYEYSNLEKLGKRTQDIRGEPIYFLCYDEDHKPART